MPIAMTITTANALTNDNFMPIFIARYFLKMLEVVFEGNNILRIDGCMFACVACVACNVRTEMMSLTLCRQFHVFSGKLLLLRIIFFLMTLALRHKLNGFFLFLDGAYFPGKVSDNRFQI